MAKSIESRAEEYAESYVNGNITWVMDQLKKTRKRASLVLAIQQWLELCGDKSYLSSFNRNIIERGL